MNYKSILIRLAGATALAQIFSAALVPIISRIYSPESFAVFTYWLTIGGLLGGILTLKQEQFLLSREINDWPSILRRLILLHQIVLVLFLASFFLYSTLSKTPHYAAYLLTFVYSLSANLIIIFCIIANVKGEFSALAKGRVIMTLALGAIQILFGLLSESANSLLSGAIVAQLAFLAVIYPAIRGISFNFPLAPLAPIQLPAAQEILKTLASIWSSVSLTVATSFLPVMVLSLGHSQEAGVLAMLQRFLMAPVTLFATPLSHVFVFFLRSRNVNKIKPRSIAAIAALISFVYFFTYCTAKIAGQLNFFSSFLGSSWKDADVLASSVASIYVGLLIRNILLQFFLVKEKQTALAITDGIFVLSLLLFYTLAHFQHLDLFEFIACLNFSYLIFALLPVLIFFKMSSREPN